MEKQFEKLRERRDERREETSAEGVKYPPHIKERLDNALANIVDAKNDEERLGAMAGYSEEMEEAKAEQERRMELVELPRNSYYRFEGVMVERHERDALIEMMKEITEDWKENFEHWHGNQFWIDHFTEEQLVVEDGHIVKLDFFGRQLTRIPPSLGKLVHLRELKFDHNRIESIEHLDELQELMELSMKKNKLKSMKGICKLKKLKLLELSENNISQIEELDDLDNLETLYVFYRNKMDTNKSKFVQIRSDLKKRGIGVW